MFYTFLTHVCSNVVLPEEPKACMTNTTIRNEEKAHEQIMYYPNEKDPTILKDDCKQNLKGLNRTKDNAMKDKSLMCNEQVNSGVLKRTSNDKLLKADCRKCGEQTTEPANDTSHSNVKMNETGVKVDF